MMKPLQMKCGIEYEYMLIDTDGEQAGRLRNFTNLDFQSIVDLLEEKPGKLDNALAIGDLGIKNGYWYLEGDERFNPDGSFHQMAVKGVEIRTPPRGSVSEAIAALKDIEPNYYNRWLVVLMVGLACASFAYLQGSDWSAFFITLVASSTAMFVRQELAKKRFVLIITFGITAFTATMIASISQLKGVSSTPNIALASSVLLLAPGFSFINSFLDALKGYLMMGWGRWMEGILLTIATSIGIIIAMALLNIKGW